MRADRNRRVVLGIQRNDGFLTQHQETRVLFLSVLVPLVARCESVGRRRKLKVNLRRYFVVLVCNGFHGVRRSTQRWRAIANRHQAIVLGHC